MCCVASKRRIFNDKVRLLVSGGVGGAGCASYARTDSGKGAPDGANGGRGGSVYLESTSTLQTYSFPTHHIKGTQGTPGGANKCTGKNGADIVIPVPAGTVVHEILRRNTETGQVETRKILDMEKPGIKLCVAKGGVGGSGNMVFRTSYRRHNRYSTSGGVGDSRWLLLELKVIADVGLVGFPNAGKSSLLARVSNATPTVAAYPFTTLQPYVGVVQTPKHNKYNHNHNHHSNMMIEPDLVDDSASHVSMDLDLDRARETAVDPLSVPSSSFTESTVFSASRGSGNGSESESVDDIMSSSSSSCSSSSNISSLDTFTMADLPGLIEGASRNVGLGHEFLRHIERTKVLLYVVDLCGVDGRDPVSDFRILERELFLYDPALIKKPAIIFANKIDHTPHKAKQNLRRLRAMTSLPVLSGSCLQGVGLSPLVSKLTQLIQQHQQRQIQHIQIKTPTNTSTLKHHHHHHHEPEAEAEAEAEATIDSNGEPIPAPWSSELSNQGQEGQRQRQRQRGRDRPTRTRTLRAGAGGSAGSASVTDTDASTMSTEANSSPFASSSSSSSSSSPSPSPSVCWSSLGVDVDPLDCVSLAPRTLVTPSRKAKTSKRNARGARAGAGAGAGGGERTGDRGDRR